jgi:hypothetical protein
MQLHGALVLASAEAQDEHMDDEVELAGHPVSRDLRRIPQP